MAAAIPRIFNPRDQLHMRGMLREPVGGNGVQIRPVDPAGNPIPLGSVPVERGLTYPINVTNVSQQFFDVDLNRRMLYLLNNDPLGIVWVFFGGAGAIVGQGMRLAPAGGGILLDNNVPTSRIYMIGTIANNPNVTAVVA
jgi:hypothetical protein